MKIWTANNFLFKYCTLYKCVDFGFYFYNGWQSWLGQLRYDSSVQRSNMEPCWWFENSSSRPICNKSWITNSSNWWYSHVRFVSSFFYFKRELYFQSRKWTLEQQFFEWNFNQAFTSKCWLCQTSSISRWSWFL